MEILLCVPSTHENKYWDKFLKVHFKNISGLHYVNTLTYNLLLEHREKKIFYFTSCKIR